VAETAGGDFAGYASAVRSGEILRICAVEVQAEYRGLGLGKALIARVLEQADSEKIPRVIIDLPAGQEHFSRALLREDFKPSVQRYCRIEPNEAAGRKK
jgi:GNAT superfamily N-acetyltransferase